MREGSTRRACRRTVRGLRDLGVDLWFSERDLVLGRGLARQLDAGLRRSRAGLVLITPAILLRFGQMRLADQELGALLGTDRVIPILHGVSFEMLRAESLLLAQRVGLTTDGSSLSEVAAKIAESMLSTTSPS